MLCVNITPLYSNAHIALGLAYARQGKLKGASSRFEWLREGSLRSEFNIVTVI